MPTVFAVGTIAAAAALWPRASGRRRRAALVFVGLMVVPAIAHRIRGTALMAFDPARAHEHADNRALGDALGVVPVAGSVLATNDLRYPANGFGRDLLQFQLTSIRGHQALALPGYERYEGWERRVLAQQALARPDAWPAALKALAHMGATHVVIHTRAPHPEVIALPTLYDGPDYRVYRLPAP